MRRRVRIAAAVLASLFVGAAALGIAAVQRTLPRRHDTARLQGLSAAASVTFDADGVPRIRAATDGDAAEALGFVHARDRWAQMDLMRRAAAGELSELVGRRALPLDEYARMLGTRDAATRAVSALPPAARAMLDAYARGVNAFIARHGRFSAPEDLVLRPPRPWTPVDSMLWAETMGLYLSGNLRTELERLTLSTRLDHAHIEALWPVQTADATGSSGRGDGAARLAAATLRAMPRFPAPFTLPATASNGWAVDGRHSITGAPLLAGDPHLSYGLPCLWYLARIDTPGATLAGATAPGIPFLVIGRNRQIAWTFTTAAADTEDVFLERVLDRDHYAGPDGPLPFGHRRERIRVRGGPDVVLDVRSTRHGPVISDLGRASGGTPAPAPGVVLAARIASLDGDNLAALGLMRLDQASDVAAAGRAATSITAPVQNLLVADRSSIALFTTGRVPVRRTGDGSVPVAGWDGAHDWTGWAAGAQLPTLVAPASGILLNANEPVSGTMSTAFMGRDAPPAWRARRIRALLSRPRHFSVADFARMQGDTRDLLMARLLPDLVAGATARDARSSAALRALGGWNADMAADRPEPLIAATWLQGVTATVLRTAGDPDGAASLPGELVLDALARSDERRCGEPCPLLLSRTLQAAVASIAATQGGKLSRWQWGRAHRAVFRNPIWGGLPLLGRLAGAAFPVGGDADTIDAQGWAGDGFTAVHGASYRGVYDLAHPDESRFVIATGESGNPFSAHLLDFTGRWQHGETITLGPQAAKVTATLDLRP